MTYYYLYGLAEGRSFRAGPFNTEREASSRGIEFCGSNFRIFPLETRNSAEAGRRIKFLLAEEGMPINNALQKQKVNKVCKKDQDNYGN
jgi:hypothetical protein